MSRDSRRAASSVAKRQARAAIWQQEAGYCSKLFQIMQDVKQEVTENR